MVRQDQGVVVEVADMSDDVNVPLEEWEKLTDNLRREIVDTVLRHRWQWLEDQPEPHRLVVEHLDITIGLVPVTDDEILMGVISESYRSLSESYHTGGEEVTL